MAISVITSTNRPEKMNNIITNFLRQEFEDKELVIILNHNYNIDKCMYDQIISNKNVTIYRLGNKCSLGYCLNFAVEKAKYEYIAKFDDDDFYSEHYLTSSLECLEKYNSDIVGKTSIYIFFIVEDILAYKNMNQNFKTVSRVKGSTLLFKKSIIKNVPFSDLNLGEDKRFCKDALDKGFKIVSTDMEHYLYMRDNGNKHTWNISNQYLLREYKKIGDSRDLENLYEKWQILT